MTDFFKFVACDVNKITTGKMARMLIVFGFAAIGFGLTLKLIFKKQARNYLMIGKVLKLLIYPIKSLPAIEFEQIEVWKFGGKRGNLLDRNWLLVTKDNVFITIRQEPSLVTLKMTFDGKYLTVSSSNDTLKIDIDEQASSKLVQTKVWGDVIKGYDCGEECSRFFSKFLNKEGVKLVRFYPDLEARSIQIFRKNRFTDDKKTKIIYQDRGPLHVINMASIDKLNDKLESYKVTYKNFRPNILIKTAEAYEEEKFEYVKIDKIEFSNQQTCLRCMVTCTDPESGERHEEPLKKLKELRMPEEDEDNLGKSPKMGIFLKSDQYGVINVGDCVYASYFQKKH